MTRIKFRAWSPLEHRMVMFGDDDFWYLSTIDNELRAIGCHNGGGDPDSEIDAAAIMQYTGLKDKNGVEIYEGDIVTVTTNHIADLAPDYPETTTTVQVKFERAMFVFGDMTMNYGGLARAKLQVKGNIYENPELLEAQS